MLRQTVPNTSSGYGKGMGNFLHLSSISGSAPVKSCFVDTAMLTIASC